MLAHPAADRAQGLRPREVARHGHDALGAREVAHDGIVLGRVEEAPEAPAGAAREEQRAVGGVVGGPRPPEAAEADLGLLLEEGAVDLADVAPVLGGQREMQGPLDVRVGGLEVRRERLLGRGRQLHRLQGARGARRAFGRGPRARAREQQAEVVVRVVRARQERREQEVLKHVLAPDVEDERVARPHARDVAEVLLGSDAQVDAARRRGVRELVRDLEVGGLVRDEVVGVEVAARLRELRAERRELDGGLVRGRRRRGARGPGAQRAEARQAQEGGEQPDGGAPPTPSAVPCAGPHGFR